MVAPVSSTTTTINMEALDKDDMGESSQEVVMKQEQEQLSSNATATTASTAATEEAATPLNKTSAKRSSRGDKKVKPSRSAGTGNKRRHPARRREEETPTGDITGENARNSSGTTGRIALDDGSGAAVAATEGMTAATTIRDIGEEVNDTSHKSGKVRMRKPNSEKDILLDSTTERGTRRASRRSRTPSKGNARSRRSSSLSPRRSLFTSADLDIDTKGNPSSFLPHISHEMEHNQTNNDRLLDTSAAGSLLKDTSAAGSLLKDNSAAGSLLKDTSAAGRNGKKNKKCSSGKQPRSSSSRNNGLLRDASISASATSHSSNKKAQYKCSLAATGSERVGSSRRMAASITNNTNTSSNTAMMVDASERPNLQDASDRRRQLIGVSSERGSARHSRSRKSTEGGSGRALKSNRSSSRSVTRTLSTGSRSMKAKAAAAGAAATLEVNKSSSDALPDLKPQSQSAEAARSANATEQSTANSNNDSDDEGEADEDDSIVGSDTMDDHPADIVDEMTHHDGNQTTDVIKKQPPVASQEFDDMGFPISTSSLPSTQNAAPGDHPDHLPDFPVNDFSFGDLAFPFNSKVDLAFDTIPSSSNPTPIMWSTPHPPANQSKIKKTEQQQQQQHQIKAEVDTKATATQPSTTTGSAETATKIACKETSEPANSSKPSPPASIWICSACKEEHDEENLQFCGMCGTTRPKVSPKPTRSTRKLSSSKREGSKGRSGEHKSPAPGSTSPRRSSSGGSGRRIRSKDGTTSTSATTRTPRSRSKGKIRPPPKSTDLPESDMMVVKCLDGGGGGKALDIDALNAQFNTFEKLEAPPTPSRSSRKKPIRRSKSDVTNGSNAGKKPTSSAPATPRSSKKKGIQRSKTLDVPSRPRTMGAVPNAKKTTVRPSIPRRSKSNTTEYLEQLKLQKNLLEDGDDKSETLTLQSRSAHAPTRPRLAAPSASRPSMMKAASSRLLGGLGNVASATTGIFSRPKRDALLLTDDEDDDDEFANGSLTEQDAEEKAGNRGRDMLRDFPTASLAKSPGRRPRGSSCEPQESSREARTNEDNVTPRRRRASLDTRAAPDMSPKKSGTVKSIWKQWGKAPRKSSSRNFTLTLDDDDNVSSESNDDVADFVGLDYNDIGIDEDDDVVIEGEEKPDPTTTPRRIRQRTPRRPISRRGPQAGAGLAKSEHATPGKFMTPRQRLRRASLTASTMQTMPDLDTGDDNAEKKPQATVEKLTNARGRIRRASIEHAQAPEKREEPVIPKEPHVEPPKPKEDNQLPRVSGHHGGGRQALRARPRRGASLQNSNPVLQQALAHMPQDPTHAVRGDIQQEWKRQEQMEDTRKKASNLKKRMQRMQGADMMAATPEPAEALFEADFSTQDAEQEAGADLEVPSGQAEDLSDISSQDEMKYF